MTQQTNKSNGPSGFFAIEIDHPLNSEVEFSPVGQYLRSRIRPIRSGNVPDPYRMIEEVPGHRIELDASKKRGVIIDLLLEPDNAQLKNEIREAGAADKLKRRWSFGKLKHRQAFELTDVEVLRWLYWMARLCEPCISREVKQRDEDGDVLLSETWHSKAKAVVGKLPESAATRAAIISEGECHVGNRNGAERKAFLAPSEQDALAKKELAK